MINIPNDPVMLLSFINLKLRDNFSSLEALCDDFDIDASDITNKLKTIDYEYDESLNQFV